MQSYSVSFVNSNGEESTEVINCKPDENILVVVGQCLVGAKHIKIKAV